MSGLLKKWFAELTKSQKRRPVSRPNQRVRLRLESLETRMVPTLMVGGFTHVAPAREVLSLADSQPAAQVRIVAPVQVHSIAPVSHSVSHPAASEIILHPPAMTGPGRGHVAINTGVRPSNTAISDNTNGSGPLRVPANTLGEKSQAGETQTGDGGQSSGHKPSSGGTGNSSGSHAPSVHKPVSPNDGSNVWTNFDNNGSATFTGWGSKPLGSWKPPFGWDKPYPPQWNTTPTDTEPPKDPDDPRNPSSPSDYPVDHNNPGASNSDYYHKPSYQASDEAVQEANSFDAENQQTGGGNFGGNFEFSTPSYRPHGRVPHYKLTF